MTLFSNAPARGRALGAAIATLLLAGLLALLPTQPVGAADGDVDLALTVVGVTPNNVAPGATVFVSITVGNMSPDEATTGPATVTVTLPPELTWTSGSQCTGSAAGPLTCATDSVLDPFSSRGVGFQVQVSALASAHVGPLTASVSGPDPDPRSDNNTTTGYVGLVTDPSHQAHLLQQATIDPLPLQDGVPATLTIDVSSLGADPAVDVLLAPLVSGMDITASPCASTCALGTIAPGDTVTRVFTVVPHSGVQSASVFHHVFSATPLTAEHNGQSNGWDIAVGSISGTVETTSGWTIEDGYVYGSGERNNDAPFATIEDGAFLLEPAYVSLYDLTVGPNNTGNELAGPQDVAVTLADPDPTVVIVVPDEEYRCPPGWHWTDADEDELATPAECEPVGTISGSVDPASGIDIIQACPGADVFAYGCGFAGPPQHIAIVDGSGFTLTVPTGTYTIRGVGFQGSDPRTDHATVTVAGDETITCDIDAARVLACAGFTTVPSPPDPVGPPQDPTKARVSGTVAAPEITLVALCAGHDHYQAGCAGLMFAFVSGGSYAISNVQPGDWTVIGATPSGASGPFTDYANVTLAAGDDLDCDVDASRHLDCEGYTSQVPPTPARVVGTMDGPDAFALLACTDGGSALGCAGQQFAFVNTGTGTFAFPPLAPGTWTITGGRQGGSVATDSATVELEAGEEVTCTITGSAIDCGGSSAEVPPGGSVSTALPDGQTPGDPVAATITSPTGGEVSIAETTVPTPTGYEALGQGWSIEAPDATVDDPLVLVFDVDASLIPVGETHETIAILRDGLPIAPCASADGRADPDPCVSAREARPEGDVRLTVLSSHASLWSVAVLADVTAPAILVTSPSTGTPILLGAVVAPVVTCFDEDGGSGIASCDYGSVATATVGDKSFVVIATDNAGNTNTLTVPYRVVYDFAGFQSPFVGGSASVNAAGTTVPVRFTLAGDQGLGVLAHSPRSRPVSCATHVPLGHWEDASGELSYVKKGGTYTYGWKTAKAWKSSCRQLSVRLVDGTEHTGYVHFLK